MKREQLPEYLFEKIHQVAPYPDKVKPVPEMRKMTAFFPGGRGLWMEELSELEPDILVLGHDFSTVQEYDAMRQFQKCDLDCATWRELRRVFRLAGIHLHRCFYSNVYMGLREARKNTGPFPGAKDRSFVERNLDFLRIQIHAVRPKMIVTLGKPASSSLSRLSGNLMEVWADGKALSTPNQGLKRRVSIDGKEYACVALEHTSMRNQNVKRRVYENEKGFHQGSEAEIQMLKDALEAVGG